MNSTEFMLALLPEYYSTGESRILIEAIGKQIEALREVILEVEKQFSITTATWGLSWWEKEYGIKSYVGKPDDQRRSVILSKKRGAGRFTIELLRTVAQSYERGLVDVYDHPEDYYFIVKFNDTLGVPPNLDDLKNAIEEIKSANLEAVYQLRYLLIKEIHQTLTVNEMQSHKLTDFSPVQPIL
ncbi:putative phage tail protein [Desulforamulus ruminis]|uniref:DUF2313 domain-containing protein n=1 Tax=Desulforamulus ruminis (strain ATCC 23193 / DSM 2154 / NCIMB 8452 / DL) TaxID=696281 RepID=F6DTE6_DESRL|nr:putative phage tail protein [Desulforamulus ruminis]AEG60008.1 hypothetical protein Desru_1744 [Desulforamulus ruminis DSM 2154]